MPSCPICDLGKNYTSLLLSASLQIVTPTRKMLQSGYINPPTLTNVFVTLFFFCMSIYLLALTLLHAFEDINLVGFSSVFPFYNTKEPHLAELSDLPTVNRCKSRGFQFTAEDWQKNTQIKRLHVDLTSAPVESQHCFQSDWLLLINKAGLWGENHDWKARAKPEKSFYRN